jgi:tRNA threonylcarbamoyladenosine biosynthesis protein TsaB
MNTLLLEASTERSIASLFKNDGIVGHAELPVGLTSSKRLLRYLQNLVKAEEIDRIIAGVGPGSYTGMRVAAAIAKTLSFARQVPLVGVCSLEGFQPGESGSFAAVIDAKISGVYIRFGRKQGDLVTWEGEAEVMSIAQAAVRLAHLDYAVTPNKEVLQQKFPSSLFVEGYPAPLPIYRAGLHKYLSGEFTTDGRLELNYLRKTDYAKIYGT